MNWNIHLQQQDNLWRNHYMVTYLMDVTNIWECIIMILYIVCGILLGIYIFLDYNKVKNMNIYREQEKIEMITIKQLLLINLLFQLLAYFIEIIGLPFINNCQNNGYFLIPIFYYIFSIIYLVSLYLSCWKTILIWGQLLCLKNNYFKLNSVILWLSQNKVFEIILIVLNTLMFIFYIFQINNFPNIITSLLNILLLILFLLISYYFTKDILQQKDIPSLVKQKMPIRVVLLSLAFACRLIWNIILIIPDVSLWLKDVKCQDERCECNQQDRYYWLIYLIFYIPISNLIPVGLFNAIFTPQSQKTKINMLLDENYESIQN